MEHITGLIVITKIRVANLQDNIFVAFVEGEQDFLLADGSALCRSVSRRSEWARSLYIQSSMERYLSL
jgi:hypothetical protein